MAAKHSLAVMLLGGKKPPMGDDEDDDAPPSSGKPPSHGDMLQSAIGEFIDAVKADDLDKATNAFRDACDLCQSGAEDEDE